MSYGSLAFLNLNVNVGSQKQVTYGWCQKFTDTDTSLNLKCCVLLQYKQN